MSISSTTTQTNNSQSIENFINTTSYDDLDTIIQLAQETKKARATEIIEQYGTTFSEIFGVQTLFDLPVVSAESLGISEKNDYPDGIAPSLMEKHSAVRGIINNERPFVAIKIEIIDPTTKKVIDHAVELIFKRYSMHGDGKKGERGENNFVTSPNLKSTTGKGYTSLLSTSNGMSLKEIKAVKELLQGNTIQSPSANTYFIKKA